MISKILYALIYLFISLYILISLISYNVYDCSYNISVNSGILNFFGKKGATISDFLIQMFGYSSILFVIILLTWSVLLFLKKQLNYFFIRLFSSLLIIVSFSFILSKFKFGNLISGPGGAIGKILATWYPINHNIYYFLILIITLALIPISIGYSLIFYSLILKKINPFNKKNITKNIKSNKIKKTNTKTPQNNVFSLPKTNLLSSSTFKSYKDTTEQLNYYSAQLIKVLSEFKVKGSIVNINQGPVVTQYELEPAAGIKSSRIIGLSDDIARSLKALSARIATIPGYNVMGIELPNKQRTFFGLKELLESKEYNDTKNVLPIILGKDISGKPYIVDLSTMPHLLIAGTTGSGKSVAINVMIISLLYKYTPAECKFIMIDPKMLELSIYDNIPHLLTPVVTEPSKAIIALKWAVKEMEYRYRLMSNLGVRNINSYNQRIHLAKNNDETIQKKVHVGFDSDNGQPVYENLTLDNKELPFIVIIVDEMADLMLTAGKEIESSVQRLSQMARAAGIHIIMATQRPSVDVITGIIKANFPSRVSFRVTSKIDSRTILGESGAEQLLGMGDMLYMSTKIHRVHCPFVSDQEVESIVNFLRSQGTPEYLTEVLLDNEEQTISKISLSNEDDELYNQAIELIKKERKISISYIQRCLRIGYNRAANIVERMEKDRIISTPSHSGKREILK